MKKRFVIALALCLALALPSASLSVALIDMKDREIVFDEPVTRMVALTAADCEILCALGCQNALVGRGAYCDYPPEIADVPAVQSGYETNVEQIIALEPQALLMGIMGQTKEQVEAIERAGVKTVVSNANDISGVYEAISMIGALMDKPYEADALIESMKASFADLSARASSNEKKSVYFEVSPLQYGLWTAGNATFMNEIAQMLNLENCFSDVEGWAEISQEQVLERDPDYIVTVSPNNGEGLTPEREIMSRAGWENVAAVKNAAILNLSDDSLTRPGPRLADGAKALFKLVYGDD